MVTPEATVLVNTYFAEELVDRIRAREPSIRVLYEPELLPVPQYPCDRVGKPRDLSEAQSRRYRELIADADVYFGIDWEDPGGMHQRSPGLRWIQATTVGIGDIIAGTDLPNRGVVITTASGVSAIPLAEFVLMGVLHFVKGMPTLRARQEGRIWARYTSRQLAGMRALVIGLGSIGRRIVSSLAALGVEVWGMGSGSRDHRGSGVSRLVERAELSNAVAQVDIVVTACPLTAETAGLIGPTEIARLRPDAIVANVGRGPVIDQAALTAALADHRIGGACLDVFDTEPLSPNDPLWAMPNVIVSSHSASAVVEENERLVDLFLENLDRFLSGAPLANQFDPGRGY